MWTELKIQARLNSFFFQILGDNINNIETYYSYGEKLFIEGNNVADEKWI